MHSVIVDKAGHDGVTRLAFPTMGTSCETRFVKPPGADLDALAAAVFEAVDRVDREMSTYKPQSDLCRFNRAPVGEWVPVSTDVVRVLAEARRVGALSGGLFDVAVLDAVQAFGFGPPRDEALQSPIAKASQEAIEFRADPPALKKHAPLAMDFSGLAKGFAVDQAAVALVGAGVDNFLVEIAGELRARGEKPGSERWRVGMELPVPGRRIIYDTLMLDNIAIATSGSYRNFRERDGVTYAHTIDPRTGRPARNSTRAATVAAESCMGADALATVLMVFAAEAAIEFCDRHDIAARLLVAAPSGFAEVASRAFAARFGTPSGTSQRHA